MVDLRTSQPVLNARKTSMTTQEFRSRAEGSIGKTATRSHIPLKKYSDIKARSFVRRALGLEPQWGQTGVLVLGTKTAPQFEQTISSIRYLYSNWREDNHGLFLASVLHRTYDVGMAISLDVRGLTVELPTRQGWIRPVNDVSFTIGEGETLGIVGESGSGKTMLALARMGLEPHGARRKGEAWLLGRSPNGNGRAKGSAEPSGERGAKNLIATAPAEMRGLRGREIAMIFQEPMTALNPVVRVGAQIEEAIRVHAPSLSNSDVRRRALQAIERAAIPEPERRSRQYPHQLSGGLRQRAMIAMALAAGPGVLIADEPTTALDVTVQRQILDLLETLRRDLRLSLLFITHDLGIVAQIADRVAVMYAGRIVEQGPASEVLRHPRHPYTEGLLRAAPRLAREKLASIPGTVPSLDALPPGCAFAPRCSLHVAECDAALPPLIHASGATENHLARCILVR
jgi:peptide/nickel transport system ATP-binding protein